MGILLGLGAALCWGTGDFMITHLTRRLGTSRAMVYIQTLSLLGWVALLAVQPMPPGARIAVWAVALGAGICHVLGLTLTYRAFEIGTLSLVSPIASGFAVVTAVLALTSGSEKPPLLALSGAALLIGGIVLATRGQGTGDQSTLAGVPEAVGSSLAFGTMFWLFDFYVAPNLGFIMPLILLKTMAAGTAWATLLASREPVQQPVPAGYAAVLPPAGGAVADAPASLSFSTWALAIGAAGTDILAWLAWLGGISTEYATIVTAVASLFSVVTILLAWGFMRERLARSQWYGIAILLLGILLVSV